MKETSTDTLERALSDTARSALARRELSRAWLREKLIKRSRVLAPEKDPAELAELHDSLLDRLERRGWLSDARFAEINLRAWRRKGKSRRWITAWLESRGVDEALIAESFARAKDSFSDELAAARVYAYRRNLLSGDRERALRSFDRQGFGYEVVDRILKTKPDRVDPKIEYG